MLRTTSRFLLLLLGLTGASWLWSAPAAAQQALPPPEQKKNIPPTPPAEKPKPTPQENKSPGKPAEGKSPEKTTPGQKPPAPSKEGEGRKSAPPQTEQKPEEKPTPTQPAGTPTPAQETGAGQPLTPATPAPTLAEPSPTTPPSPTPQPTPTAEATPAQAPPVKPVRETSPAPTPARTPPPLPPISSVEGGSERSQWSFRGEMEALAQTFSFGKVFFSVLILLLGYFTNKFVVLLAARASKRRNAYAGWLRRLIPFASFGLWFLVVLVIVETFTQSLLAVILLILVAAVALALASQPLLRDLVGGLVILFERPFRLGDRITIGEHRGEVKEIGLRAFQLVSPTGALIALPNALVLGQPVVNTNPGVVESRVTTELLLPEGCDPEQARKIAFEAAAVSPYACIHKPIEVYVDEQDHGEPQARVIVQAYVFDVQYERELRSDTIQRAWRGFQRLRRRSNAASVERGNA